MVSSTHFLFQPLTPTIMKTKILVVEDDQSLRSVLISAIEKEGHEVTGAESAESAAEILSNSQFEIVLTDINLPGKDGLDLIPEIHATNPNAYIMVMTGYGTLETAIEAMKRGAHDFLRKPIVFNDLTNAIQVAVENQSSSVEEKATEIESDTFSNVTPISSNVNHPRNSLPARGR